MQQWHEEENAKMQQQRSTRETELQGKMQQQQAEFDLQLHTATQSLVAAAELAGGESAAGTWQLPWLETLALMIDVLIAAGEWRSSGWSPPLGPQSVTNFANSLCESHPTALRSQIYEMLRGSPFERGLRCDPATAAVYVLFRRVVAKVLTA
jgi:hypothetical protein